MTPILATDSVVSHSARSASSSAQELQWDGDAHRQNKLVAIDRWALTDARIRC